MEDGYLRGFAQVATSSLRLAYYDLQCAVVDKDGENIGLGTPGLPERCTYHWLTRYLVEEGATV